MNHPRSLPWDWLEATLVLDRGVRDPDHCLGIPPKHFGDSAWVTRLGSSHPVFSRIKGNPFKIPRYAWAELCSLSPECLRFLSILLAFHLPAQWDKALNFMAAAKFFGASLSGGMGNR